MPLHTKIEDGLGTGNVAKVGTQNQLFVSVLETPLPTAGTENRLQFFSGLLGTTGIDSGTTNMAVDGSTTPVEFYIAAQPDADVHITQFVFSLVDFSVNHSEWGNLGALTTGFDVIIRESGNETPVVDKAKTFFDIIKQTVMEKPFGNGTTAFEIESVIGSDDAQVLPFDLAKYVPGGFRIGVGTGDRIIARVNDDLSGLTSQEVRVLGYKKFS